MKEKQYNIHIKYPEIESENSIDIPIGGNLEDAEAMKNQLDEWFPKNSHEVHERKEDA